MVQATIKDILNELRLKELKKACVVCGIPSEGRRYAPLRQALFEVEWTAQMKSELKKIFIEMKKGDEINCAAHIFKSNDLSSRGSEEIVRMLERRPVRGTNNQRITDGFEHISLQGEEIKGIYKGSNSRVLSIGRDIIKERRIISIPFSIFRERGFVLVNSLNQKDVKTFREFLQNILGLDKLYYAIPEGIKEEGVDVRDYNGRANDFVNNLDIEEIRGVFLKISGNTRITAIDYKGHDNILQENEIRDKIRGGALITGLKGLIRHGELLISFTIKWGWFAKMHVSGERISSEIIWEVIKEIYSTYVEHILT